MSQRLFSPVHLGAVELPNRILMAPMTRARTPTTVPNAANATYYTQRAGAGLILTEATQVSIQGRGAWATPGIHTAEQIAGWRKVTESVHAAGGRIFCQIWHSGRVSHGFYQEGGQAPVSSSATKGAVKTFIDTGFVDTPEPRALREDEIPGVIAQYRQGALNAIAAGFDGVEIHGANGYLIDQFLRDGVNRRTDAWGGSVQNRCRFLLAVVDAVSDAIGADRTALRLSPFSVTWDCRDSNPKPLFLHAVSALSSRNLAFLEIVEAINEAEGISSGCAGGDFTLEDILAAYRGRLVVNGGYDGARAEVALGREGIHAISIGRPFITNPDLPRRIERGLPLAPSGDPAVIYGGGEAGYIDFPPAGD
jgi:N-ethylmaleimide reductase